MADTKISALTAVSTVTGAQEFGVNDGGVSKKANGTQISDFFATQPFAAKFWVSADGNSTTMDGSYNMTSWADTGIGDADGTIATDFADVNWIGQVTVLETTTGWTAANVTGCGFNAQAAGTFGVLCGTIIDGGTAVAALADPDEWYVIGFGTQ